jgi:hypothetical protein
MEGHISCATLEEGSVEMVLKVSRGMSGHGVRGVR